jgi:hypothetical protein
MDARPCKVPLKLGHAIKNVWFNMAHKASITREYKNYVEH